MHYLKVAKVRTKLSPNIMYPRKSSWKGKAAIPEIEKKQGNHFVEKCSQK